MDEIKYELIKSREKIPGVVVCFPFEYMRGLGGWVRSNVDCIKVAARGSFAS